MVVEHGGSESGFTDHIADGHGVVAGFDEAASRGIENRRAGRCLILFAFTCHVVVKRTGSHRMHQVSTTATCCAVFICVRLIGEAAISWQRGRWVTKSGSVACRCARSEEHTSELQSLMRISYAVFCLKKKKE